MKIIKIIASVILLVVMAALTAFGYFLKSSLVGGRIDSMEEILAVRGAWPAILFIICGFLLFYYLSRPTKVKLIFLGITLVFWFLSGRMISMVFWPDGRLTVGWFNMPTQTVHLCHNKTDCDTTIDYQTKAENLFFWRIRIKNKDVDEVIFVGPFLWGKAAKMIHETIGAGNNTRIGMVN